MSYGRMIDLRGRNAAVRGAGVVFINQGGASWAD